MFIAHCGLKLEGVGLQPGTKEYHPVGREPCANTDPSWAAAPERGQSKHLGDGPVDDGLGTNRVVLEAEEVVRGHDEVVTRRQHETLGDVCVELAGRRLRWG